MMEKLEQIDQEVEQLLRKRAAIIEESLTAYARELKRLEAEREGRGAHPFDDPSLADLNEKIQLLARQVRTLRGLSLRATLSPWALLRGY